MDLHDGDEGRIEVVVFGFFDVQDVDWEHSARYGEYGTAEKVFRKFLSVESSGERQ